MMLPQENIPLRGIGEEKEMADLFTIHAGKAGTAVAQRVLAVASSAPLVPGRTRNACLCLSTKAGK